jgi:predicted aldo/keto reductase-like oxidoreductase
MEMSKIIIGAMRFKDRESAVSTIREAIDSGFNYIDTSPCYCYKNADENSESWVGEAVNYRDYRDRVMISAKCSPGNGGMLLGEFKPEQGFGVRTIEQLKQVFNQSLSRQKLESFDYYHLWTTHTAEQLNEALKPGGWYDGVMSLKGKWKHLGITTHADTPTILEFLKRGKFDTVTIPLNVVNRTREGILDYCKKTGIRVIAMNPLAGGFLAGNERLKELAFRYLFSLPDVHILVGFTSVEEVRYARRILDKLEGNVPVKEEVLAEADAMLDTKEPRCTSCGYCAPCPQGLNLGACLSYYNIYKYMKMAEAREAFQEKQWEEGLRLDRCVRCGICQSRCPNSLPLMEIIPAAQEMLYRDR